MSNDSDPNTSPPWGIAGNSTCIDWSSPDAVWPYCPSYGAAILFAVLYFLTTSCHLVQAIVYRKPFCWVVIMAAGWEFAGFAIRAASTQFQGSLGLFFVQQVLILLAPIWLNAFIYMVFGRMVLYFLPDQRIWKIKARRLTLLFVLLDILSFLVQLGGGSMLSSTDANTIKIGQNLYMGGIGVQLFFFTAFLGLTVLFYRKVRQEGNIRSTDWRWLLYIIYAEYVLIAVRIIFRLVEFSAGVNGPVPHTESFFYVFEALPMTTAMVLFNAHHPGRVLSGRDSEFKKTSKAEKRQLKQYEILNESRVDRDWQHSSALDAQHRLHTDEERGIEVGPQDTMLTDRPYEEFRA